MRNVNPETPSKLDQGAERTEQEIPVSSENLMTKIQRGTLWDGRKSSIGVHGGKRSEEGTYEDLYSRSKGEEVMDGT